MMGKEFAPGDDGGVSKRITEESSGTLESHHQTQLDKQWVGLHDNIKRN